MIQNPAKHHGRAARWFVLAVIAAFGVTLVAGSWRNAHFWLSADQKGEMLFREKKFAEAAKAYANPYRVGEAQYRNSDFEAAAKTFARVPGADGAFNQGNAWLMRGKYSKAIESYDRALGFHPAWKEALENKALAIARQKLLDDSSKDRDQETTDAYTPDEIAFDQKGGDQKEKPMDLGDETMSDEAIRATWLRRVQTTPAEFLRAKFAYQAARASEGQAAKAKEGAK